jgi:hypothetical protein
VILQVSYKAYKDAAAKDIAGPVQSHAGMESHINWGSDIPLLLRNENWDYALFAADGKRHDELNEAQCVACHKPKEPDSYVFTISSCARRAARSVNRAPIATIDLPSWIRLLALSCLKKERQLIE